MISTSVYQPKSASSKGCLRREPSWEDEEQRLSKRGQGCFGGVRLDDTGTLRDGIALGEMIPDDI